jgi:hypothetical protein
MMKLNTTRSPLTRGIRLIVDVFLLASFLAATAAGQTCTTADGMTKFESAPQDFNSIVIQPGCVGDTEKLITTDFTWTIEPVTDSDADQEVAIYTVPANAVRASVEDNALVFDFVNLETPLPDKVGVVIQVPASQLLGITLNGINSQYNLLMGFDHLQSLSYNGNSNNLIADLSSSTATQVNFGATSCTAFITSSSTDDSTTGISLDMSGTSSILQVSGNVEGGQMTGFAYLVMVQGEISNFSLDGPNERIVVSTSCDGVQVKSDYSSCTVNESLTVDRPEPVSCTSSSRRITCRSDGVASFHGTNRASWTLTFALVLAFAVATGL